MILFRVEIHYCIENEKQKLQSFNNTHKKRENFVIFFDSWIISSE